MKLGKELRKKALDEMSAAIKEHEPGIDNAKLRKILKANLIKKIEDFERTQNEFIALVERARLTGSLNALRDNMEKDLRRDLRSFPRITKETAHKIIAELRVELKTNNGHSD